MEFDLNEQTQLIDKTIKKKSIIKKIIISFIIVIILLISMSGRESANTELYMENYKLYTENAQLKELLNNKIKSLENRSDSLYKLGLNLSPNNNYINSDTFNINNVNTIIKTTEKLLDNVDLQINTKLDSIINIPVFMPILTIDFDKITDNYGWRKHPIYKRWLFHEGIDIKTKYKTNVLATSDGVVIMVIKSKKGYGNRIVIDHKNGYKTLYAHLQGFNIKLGDKVKRGDIIGYVGSTGLSTGTHLHYEIIKNNRTVNPIEYLYDVAKK